MASFGTSGFTQKHLTKYLENFGKNVITGAQKNLVKGRHIRTGNLYRSLNYKMVISENSFWFNFTMEPAIYGVFLDQGTRYIKPTYFFQKPFDEEYANLEDDVIEQFGLDIDDFLQHSAMDINPNYKYYETK